MVIRMGNYDVTDGSKLMIPVVMLVMVLVIEQLCCNRGNHDFNGYYDEQSWRVGGKLMIFFEILMIIQVIKR